jgi:hypothetical protein
MNHTDDSGENNDERKEHEWDLDFAFSARNARARGSLFLFELEILLGGISKGHEVIYVG